MTGRTISEFITELYNNPEMEFIYHSNPLYDFALLTKPEG